MCTSPSRQFESYWDGPSSFVHIILSANKSKWRNFRGGYWWMMGNPSILTRLVFEIVSNKSFRRIWMFVQHSVKSTEDRKYSGRSCTVEIIDKTWLISQHIWIPTDAIYLLFKIWINYRTGQEGQMGRKSSEFVLIKRLIWTEITTYKSEIIKASVKRYKNGGNFFTGPVGPASYGNNRKDLVKYNFIELDTI